MSEHPHRRDFVRTLALGASVGLLNQPESAPASAIEEEEKDEEVEARMALILARYGDQLDEEARSAVRRDVHWAVERARRLRRFALENGDGPAPIFVPYREPLA